MRAAPPAQARAGLPVRLRAPRCMLITTQSLFMEGQRMSDQIAEHDITAVNHLGQTVVLVHKGQPIPADLAEAKQVEGPPENKAAGRAKRKRAA